MRTRKVLSLLGYAGLITGMLVGLIVGFRVDRIYPQNGWQFDLQTFDNADNSEGLVVETEFEEVVLEDGFYSIRFDVKDDDSEALVVGNWYGLTLAKVIHLHKSRLQ